jgi:hypothetical protein
VTPGKAVLFTVVLLALLAGWALVRRYQKAHETFATLTADETDHTVQLSDRLPVVLLPDGFTCLRCEENPALLDRIWCAVCARIVDTLPSEPIDRGGLEGCISRHPAGNQRKTGGHQ